MIYDYAHNATHYTYVDKPISIEKQNPMLVPFASYCSRAINQYQYECSVNNPSYHFNDNLSPGMSRVWSEQPL